MWGAGSWTQPWSPRLLPTWASQVALVVKNPPAGDFRTMGSRPGLGRSPGGEHGNPLQHSCLENSMDRGAWRATVHKVTKSQTQLSDLGPTLLHTRPFITEYCYWALLLSNRKTPEPGTKAGTRNVKVLFTNNTERSSLTFSCFVNYYRYLPAMDFLNQTSSPFSP